MKQDPPRQLVSLVQEETHHDNEQDRSRLASRDRELHVILLKILDCRSVDHVAILLWTGDICERLECKWSIWFW